MVFPVRDHLGVSPQERLGLIGLEHVLGALLHHPVEEHNELLESIATHIQTVVLVAAPLNQQGGDLDETRDPAAAERADVSAPSFSLEPIVRQGGGLERQLAEALPEDVDGLLAAHERVSGGDLRAEVCDFVYVDVPLGSGLDSPRSTSALSNNSKA